MASRPLLYCVLFSKRRATGIEQRKIISDTYKWWAVIMLWAACFLNYADRQVIYSIFPLLEKDLHLTPVQLGLLGSVFAWVYGLGAPLAGYVVDRIRRKSAIVSGLFAWSVICASTAASRGLGSMLFFRAAEGMSETIYFPAAMSLLSDYHSEGTRSRALGLHQPAVYAGAIAGGYFAGLIAQNLGWQWPLVVFGGTGILLAMVLHRLLIEPRRGASEFKGNLKWERITIREFIRIVWNTPKAMLLMAAFLCSNSVGVVVLTWMPKFVYDRFHLSVAAAGLTATLFVHLASVPGSGLGGWFADSMQKRTSSGRIMVQAFGVLCSAPFVVICGLTASITWLILSLIAWGLFKGFYDANIFASLFDTIPPEARGISVGVMNMVGWLGGGMAPIIVGYIAQRQGLSFAIALAATGYVVAAALLAIAALVPLIGRANSPVRTISL